MRSAAAATFGFVTLAAWRAEADSDECRAALEEEDTAKEDVDTAREAYTACTAGGSDDCTAEFNALHEAQEDWEDAVSNRQTNCT